MAACPSHIFEVTERGGRKAAAPVASRTKGCMRCGQCMALCPTQSVVVEGLDYQRDFFPLAPRQLELEGLERFLGSRRSVRVFRDEPVPREML